MLRDLDANVTLGHLYFVGKLPGFETEEGMDKKVFENDPDEETKAKNFAKFVIFNLILWLSTTLPYHSPPLAEKPALWLPRLLTLKMCGKDHQRSSRRK